MKPVRRPPPPGFALIVLILTTAIIMMFFLLMARLVALEFGRERQAYLAERAYQIAASARDRTGIRGATWTGEPQTLPVDGLLPPHVQGAVELHQIRTAEGDVLVECRITLQQGGTRLRQQFHWPLPASVGGLPAESAPVSRDESAPPPAPVPATDEPA